MRRHPRRAAGTALAAGVLLAPLVVAVLAGPAGAGAPRRHDVDTYKREGWTAVGDQAPTSTVQAQLACEPGDYAVDGVWKVDAHDGDPRSLRVTASYGDDVDVGLWHFGFTNDGPGRAQVKLFVTCLVPRTGDREDGHHHGLLVGPRTTQTLTGSVAGPLEVDAAPHCTRTQVPLAPGFSFVTGGGSLYRSHPTAAPRGWHWGFRLDGAAELQLHLRCLDRRTTPAGAGGHVHRLDVDLAAAYAGQHVSLAAGPDDRTVGARRGAEGLVGAFWIEDPFHVAYLGQDPRGQVRGFRFWNDGTGSSDTWLGLLGLGTRTGRQLAP